MIQAFYGTDTYSSRQKVYKLVGMYLKKTGEGAHADRMDAEETDVDGLRALLESGSLFSASKFIILEYVLTGAKRFDDIEQLLKRIAGSPHSTVILWDRELNAEGKKRLTRLKPLLDHVEEFKGLSGITLDHWLKGEAAKRNLNFSAQQLHAFLAESRDLWLLANRLDAQAVGAPKSSFFSVDSGSKGIFALGDIFFSSPRNALALLRVLLQNGEDPFGLFAYLAGHCRTLLIVKWHAEQKKAIPASYSIHPFVAKKSLALAGSFSEEYLRWYMLQFFEADWSMKTGLITPADALMTMLLAAMSRAAPSAKQTSSRS